MKVAGPGGNFGKQVERHIVPAATYGVGNKKADGTGQTLSYTIALPTLLT